MIEAIVLLVVGALLLSRLLAIDRREGRARDADPCNRRTRQQRNVGGSHGDTYHEARP